MTQTQLRGADVALPVSDDVAFSLGEPDAYGHMDESPRAEEVAEAEAVEQDIQIPVIESGDIQHYLQTVKGMAGEVLTLYQAITEQNTEKGLTLSEIAKEVLSKMLESGEQVHSTQTIETVGLVTISLPHNTPFTRLQRAMTVASLMSGEGIPSELTLVDSVSTLAATTLLKVQEVRRTAAAKSGKPSRRNSRQKRKARATH